MLNNSHKMPNNTRSIAKMSLNSTQPTTIVCECLTAPRNDLCVIFDLHIIFMLILFADKITKENSLRPGLNVAFYMRRIELPS